MNKYISALFIGASLLGLTACNDYLNQEPEDQIIPENFFVSTSNLSAYTQNFYGLFPNHSQDSYGIGTFNTDNGTDNQAAIESSSRWQPGQWKVGQGAGNYDFGTIRQVNFFLTNVPDFAESGMSGSESEYNQAVGEAYFFRAYVYYSRLKEFGDFPIITEVLSDNKEELLEASVRQPRNKVARFILDDLTKAISYLPDESSKGKNGLNKACAQLFRSRVALFEGTWLKYHKGTALVPGGPGWPGDASLLEGFNIDNEITYFLTEALNSAKPVADATVNNLVENTDTEEGMSNGSTVANPYYCMYCMQDLSPYSEVLLYKYFSTAEGVSTQIQNQFQTNGEGTGWTRGMVNSYLMRNGLPIYAAGSGYDPAWEDQGVTATLQGRDSRIQIFTKGDHSVDTYSLDDGSPIYFRMGWLLDGDTNTKNVTGFAVKKGKSYDYTQAQGNLQGVTGSIIFRATEAMLNYMEACVELNGNVDGTADSYWRAIRRRAYVDDNYNKTIAATQIAKEAEGDWGAYSHGTLIDPTLYNVRRERRNELSAEALRWDDLRRWCALDQMIQTPYIVEGIKYWNTVYTDENSPLCMKNTAGEYLEPIVSPETGTGTMSPKENSDYVRPYQIVAASMGNLVYDGYHWCRAQYLSPIGQSVFANASPDEKVENSVVYQNPGWPKTSGESADWTWN